MSMKQGPMLTMLVGLLIIILIGGVSLMYIAGIGPFAGKGPGGVTTTQIVSSTVIGAVCNPATAQPITEMLTHYSSDATMGATLVWNRFVQNSAGQLVQVSDNPGTLTDGTAHAASNNLYSIGPPSSTFENLYQGTQTNYPAYPVWYQVNSGMLTNPVQQFGNSVFQISCVPSTSNPNAYSWAITGVLFEGPGNGATSTTNATAAIQYPAGAPTAFPTASATWNVNLNINVGYKTAMLPYAQCGTQANPVYNYATSTEYYGCPAGPGQGGLPTVSGFLLIIANQTGISVSANGLVSIKSPAMATGTMAWAVPVTGTGVAPSSASSTDPYKAVSVPVTIVQNVAATGAHGTVVFWFVDMQQLAYLQDHLSTVAAGSWSTVGATGAGTARAGNALTSYFGGLTPTTGQNVGSMAPLISQAICVELTY